MSLGYRYLRTQMQLFSSSGDCNSWTLLVLMKLHTAVSGHSSGWEPGAQVARCGAVILPLTCCVNLGSLPACLCLASLICTILVLYLWIFIVGLTCLRIRCLEMQLCGISERTCVHLRKIIAIVLQRAHLSIRRFWGPVHMLALFLVFRIPQRAESLPSPSSPSGDVGTKWGLRHT